MDHPNELIERLRGEEASLQERIERLEREAKHPYQGVRQYRCHRVSQLRQRQYTLRDRIRRVEAHAHEWEAVRPEAERLYLDLKETHALAERTFH